MAVNPDRAAALALAKGLSPTPKNIERIAGATGPEAASWAFTQWELRRRARAKFKLADEMLFDRDGLEMASHEGLAITHDAHFPKGSRVADLTCGIGSDTIALARSCEVVGFEIDQERAEFARHNLALHGLSAEMRVEDCMAAYWDFRYAFADPSRRSAGTRKFDPEAFLPPLSKLVERMSQLSLGLIKLSAMLPDSVLRGLGGRVDFASLGGECREALVHLGKEPIAGGGASVWAFQADKGRWLSGETHKLPDPVETPSGFFFEADPAAIRAHALGGLCRQGGLAPLGDSNGYLTGDSVLRDDLAEHFVRPFRALSFGHADEKAIRADLKRLGAKIEAVKVRGVKEDPIVWKKRLRSAGGRPLDLALYPVGRSLRYALIQPIESPGKNT